MTDWLDGYGTTPMHLAVMDGLKEVVRYIEKKNPGQVNVADLSGITPLILEAIDATSKNRDTEIKLLLELGADVNAVDKDGNTALDLAVKENSLVARACLESWIKMSEEKRNLIIADGWDYVEMPTWRPSIHYRFPAHLRAQVHAVAVSLADMHIAPVLELIAKGIDALKRKRALEI